VLPDEFIIVQVRIGLANPVDLFFLTRTECFLGIQAPDALEQSLSAQNLVNPGDTTRKAMGGVKESGVGVSGQ
jgi:hypothetical protein